MSEEKPEKDYTLVFCLRRKPIVYDIDSATQEGGESQESSIAKDAGSGGAINAHIQGYDGEIMLGLKKRGFGMGKWNGFGGKVEQGESNEEAARRELEEESGVVAQELERVGFLKFLMCNKIMNVHVYTCYSFLGEGVESEEMRPKWFQTSEIHTMWDKMWPDDRFWLPVVLKGQKFIARYQYDDNDETIIDQELTLR